jgi:hypothetical protein
LGRRLGRPQGQSGSHGEEKNLPPAGNSKPADQPVAATLTELSWLISCIFHDYVL